LFEITEQKTNPSFPVKYKRLLPESKSGQVCGIDGTVHYFAVTVDAHSDDLTVGQLTRNSIRKTDVVMGF